MLGSEVPRKKAVSVWVSWGKGRGCYVRVGWTIWSTIPNHTVTGPLGSMFPKSLIRV